MLSTRVPYRKHHPHHGKILLTGLAALAVFIWNDKVIWKVGLVLALGNMAGAWFSSRISVKKGDGFIKTFLIIMVLAMAVRLWFYT